MYIAKRQVIVLACIFGVLLGMTVTFTLHSVQPSYAVDTATASKADRGTLLSIQNAFASIADELKPAVVYITAERTETSSGPDLQDLFRGFPFGDMNPFPKSDQKRRSTVGGSGVIVRNDGYIITNDHVVAGADRVTVVLNDKSEYPGKVLRDPRNDLALIKIEAKNLPTAKIGDSDKVKVGQWAIAIGSPFGLTNTVTVGVISALTRGASVPDPNMPEGRRDYPDLIQTDASINMGNSGGPLVDINGEIIGINSVIESPTGTNAGIGFAVPSNTAKYVMEQLVTHGKIAWGYLGVEIRDISPAASKTLGTDKGALVNRVTDDSPADKAGMKPMDVITEVNGVKIEDSLGLRRAVERIKPGTKVPIVLLREEKKKTVQVTVGEAPGAGSESQSDGKSKVGVTVTELTSEFAERLGLDAGTQGVLVKSVDPDGAAARSRPPISPGDVVLKINRQPTKMVSDFNKAVGELKSGDTALVLIQRRGRTTISELTLD
ncbi:MAG: Do family serine endopeptidase [Armatimonadetes bacterium]|nr:Do family serine endopeptidase [Armatimonadota bacterium]